MGKLMTVKIAAIRENPVALRAVNRDSEDYLGLLESIRSKGFIGAISVREKNDPETQTSYYELVDGLHRYSAAKDAGLDSINVDCVDLDAGQVLEVQIMSNIHKIETKPIEYSKQLIRILAMSPLMTESQLAAKLGKSPQWIKERLGLNKIEDENVAALINEGKITLSNAYALAKLPAEEIAEFLDRAMTLAPDEFIPAVNARVKEIKEAKRKGQDAAELAFEPVAYMQKLKDIRNELETGSVAKSLIKATGVKDAAQGFSLAVQWMLHLDPKSVEVQKAEDDARRAARDEKAKERAKLNAAKKAEKAKKAADEAAAAAASIL